MSSRQLFSNALDLDEFFYAARDQIYAIIKLGDFPNYYKGSDIDVFCYNKNDFAQIILGVGNKYLNRGFEIKVVEKTTTQTYLDFYLEGSIDLRFDLYQSFPDYKKIKIKEHYLLSVVENAVSISREFRGNRYSIYVPSDVDELLLRYIEYIEWYELRPDKIKHLEFIINSIDKVPERIGFLDKLHLYTEIPCTKIRGSWLDRFYFIRWITFWIKRLRSIHTRKISETFFHKLQGSDLN
jgi:hypothetical protein